MSSLAMPDWAAQPSQKEIARTLWRAIRHPRRLHAFRRRVRRSAHEAETTIQAIDWIIVPGFRLDGDEVPRLYAQRLERTRVLLTQHPQAKLLISGAPGRYGRVSEAMAGFEWLVDHHAPIPWPPHLDHDARNTAQNLVLAAQRIHVETPTSDKPTIAIVSNRFHLARLALLAEAANLNTHMIAAETDARHSWLLTLASWREALAMLYWSSRVAETRTQSRIESGSRDNRN